jgi:formiminotetrahydrofolate cyclodeaminase
MNEMKNMTLKEFAGVLASDAPAPGGGSVAALCSSLSAALSSMVFKLTIDKKFYNEYDEELKNKMKEYEKIGETIKDDFLELMDIDTEAFNKVMAAFKLPKETDDEKAIRSQKIQEGYIEAMQVPFSVAKKTILILDYLEIAIKYGNPNAASDAGVGVLLALAGLEGAILNVKINVGSIKDKDLVNKVLEECENLMQRGTAKKNELLGIVYSKIS